MMHLVKRGSLWHVVAEPRVEDFFMVMLNFGLGLRASRKTPIQYSACAKSDSLFTSWPLVKRGRPRMNLLPRGDDRFHSQSMDGSGQRLYVGSETTLAEVQAQLQMRHRDACVGFMGVRQEQPARKHHES